MTRMRAPKDAGENAEFREWLGRRCESDEGFRARVMEAVAADPVFFCDAVLTVVNPKLPPGVPKVLPMVTWPRQEELLEWYLERVRAQTPGVVFKTREQAGTWTWCAASWWAFLFLPETLGLIASRKKDLVEAKDVGGLMQKYEHLWRSMPAWMRPEGLVATQKGTPWRQDMAILNPSNGNSIIGDTANPDIARGLRYTWIFLDEFPACESQDSVQAAAANAAKCVIYCGTVLQDDLFVDMATSGEHEVFVLDWVDNPLCTAGGVWHCEAGKCRVHRQGGMPHSAWYDEQCRNYNWDPVKIAQELDRNVARAGGAVFDEASVKAALEYWRANPAELTTWDLRFDLPPDARETPPAQDPEEWQMQTRPWPVVATQSDTGVLRVWKRPYQRGDEVYVAGGDVAKGLSGKDMSVLYVVDVTTGDVVAEHASRMDPDLLGVEWAKVCKWYGTSSGGEENAWAGIEWNDHGLTVNRTLKRMGVWVQHYISEDKSQSKPMKYEGIVVHWQNRQRLIGEHLVPAIRERREDGTPVLRCPFVEFWSEAGSFVDIKGKWQPASKKKHDDRLFAMNHLIYAAKKRHGRWATVPGRVPPALRVAREREATLAAMEGRLAPVRTGTGRPRHRVRSLCGG